MMMAGPTGFEPATSRLTIWRPNQAERRPLPTHTFQRQHTRHANPAPRESGATRIRWRSLREDTLPGPVPRGARPIPRLSAGRRNRDRTCDLCLVRAALSRLSYPPENPSVARQLGMLSTQPDLVNRTPALAHPRFLIGVRPQAPFAGAAGEGTPPGVIAWLPIGGPELQTRPRLERMDGKNRNSSSVMRHTVEPHGFTTVAPT